MTQKHDITLDINGKKYELTVEPGERWLML